MAQGSVQSTVFQRTKLRVKKGVRLNHVVQRIKQQRTLAGAVPEGSSQGRIVKKARECRGQVRSVAGSEPEARVAKDFG